MPASTVIPWGWRILCSTPPSRRAIDDEEEDCELPDSPEDDNTEGSPAPAPEAMPNTGAAPVPPVPGGEEAGAHDWALYDGELPDEPVGW